MKLWTIILASLLTFSTGAFAVTLNENVKPTDLRTYALGDPAATLYVFTGLQCPHCSVFHAKVLPTLKSEFVDTGLVKMVMVDMSMGRAAMMGSMLSRCVVPNQFDMLQSVLYQNQSVWGQSSNPRQIISNYARLMGMTDTDINQCLSDRNLQKTLLEQQQNLSNLYNVQAMPTVVLVHKGKQKKLSGTDTDVIVSTLKKELQ